MKKVKRLPTYLPGLMVFFLLAGMPCGWVHSAEMKANASVDRTRTTMDTPITLTVVIQGGEGRVDTSAIRDFKVVSGGTSTSIKMYNQEVERELIYKYRLIPLKKGKCLVPALHVRSGEKTYKTGPITITVSNQSEKRSEPRRYFVRAEISDPNPYEGQQLVYTFKLFHTVDIRNTRFQEPRFNHFTAKRLEKQKNYQTILNHVQYQVVELSWILVPLKTGKQTIEPAVLQCDVSMPGRRGRRFGIDSFFDDSFFSRGRLEKKILKTRTLTLEVKPLPEYTGDYKFAGLVGRFDIKAALNEKEINVGDSATLSITVSGTGNIMDVAEMDVAFPKALKTYRDNPEEDVKLGQEGYYGSKTFRFALVPLQAGRFEIPGAGFSYFDVAAGGYRSRSAEALFLDVRPSGELDTDDPRAPEKPVQGSAPKKFRKKKVEFTGRDILPVKNELNALENKAPLSIIRFLFYLIIPVLLWGMTRLTLLLTLKKDDPASIMAQRADELLKDISNKDKTDELFLQNLYRALISTVLSRAGLLGESLTYTEVKTLLDKNRCNEDAADRMVALLKRIDSIKYGGHEINPALREELLMEARKIIREIVS